MSRPGFRILFLFPLLAAGCSSEGTITGKVTYQGRPLAGGTVLFTSPEGSTSTQIAEDGTYTITRMKTGLARIAVETKSAQGPMTSGPKTGASKKSSPPGMGKELPPEAAKSSYAQGVPRTIKVEKIPEGYADPDKSELTYTVVSGPQEFNIELK